MMELNTSDVIYLIRCTATLVSSLMGVGMVLGSFFRRERMADRPLLRVAMFYFGMVAASWLILIFYRFNAPLYAHVNALFYLAAPTIQVLLYHLIFALTGTGGRNRFPWVHYAIPVAIATVFELWSLAVPFSVRLALVTSLGEWQEGYEAYSAFFTSRIQLRGVYGIIYVLLGIVRLRRYRRAVGSYSADSDRSSLRWVQLLIVLSAMIIPMPLAAFFVRKQQLVESLVFMLPNLLLVTQHCILASNLLLRRFVLIEPMDGGHAAAPNRHHAVNLTRAELEAYIDTQKPFLNPELKITDLVGPLSTNRTYLSDFINREYGVNFSRYINKCRLTELDRLMADPANAHKSKMELVTMAGFSSYHGYYHFAKQSEEANSE